MKKKIVKIEILRSWDKKNFEVYLDGNRLHGVEEIKIIQAISREYLEKKI